MLDGIVFGHENEKESVKIIYDKLSKRGNDMKLLVLNGVESGNTITIIDEFIDDRDFVVFVLSAKPKNFKTPFRVLTPELKIVENMAMKKGKIIYYVTPEEANEDWE